MLRPHTAAYTFVDGRGDDAGREQLRLLRQGHGWLLMSRLEIATPEGLTTDIEWHLEADLSTHLLYIATTNHWGEELTLELAVTGNGLLASRTGPDGPTQVEMGWGPRVELDHLSAAFTTVFLARWLPYGGAAGDVATVYIGAEDLEPEALLQQYRVVTAEATVTTVERSSPDTGSRALITALPGGVVGGYEGLFRLEASAFTS